MQKLSDKSKIAKNALFLYVRMILVMVISLISVRLLLQTLGVVDYGIYSAIAGVVTSIAFLTSTLSFASQRYFSYDIGKEDGRIDVVFNTIIAVYILISIIIIIPLIIGGLWLVENKMVIPKEAIGTSKIVLVFSAITFIVTILTNPFIALIMANEDMKLYAILSLLDAFLKFVAVLILLLPIDNRLIIYSISLLIVALLFISISFCICRKKYAECKLSFQYDSSLLKSIFCFSSWTLFGSAAGMGYNQGLNILLNLFIGPTANAAFAVGNQIANAINSLSSGFFSAVRPSFIKSIALNERNYSIKIFEFSNKISFILLSMITIPLIVNTQFVLDMWLGECQEYMVPFTRLLIASIIIQNIGMPLTTLAQAANIVKRYHLMVDGFTIIGLFVLYYILKEFKNPILSLEIYVCVFIIAHFIRLYITKSVIKFSIKKYLFGYFIPCLICYLIILALCFKYNQYELNGYIKFIGCGVLSTSFLLTFSFVYLLNKDERQVVKTKLRSKINL